MYAKLALPGTCEVQYAAPDALDLLCDDRYWLHVEPYDPEQIVHRERRQDGLGTLDLEEKLVIPLANVVAGVRDTQTGGRALLYFREREDGLDYIVGKGANKYPFTHLGNGIERLHDYLGVRR